MLSLNPERIAKNAFDYMEQERHNIGRPNMRWRNRNKLTDLERKKYEEKKNINSLSYLNTKFIISLKH